METEQNTAWTKRSDPAALDKKPNLTEISVVPEIITEDFAPSGTGFIFEETN